MKTFTYKNPINTDVLDNIRDPFIIKDNGKYYLTGTFPPYWTGESDGVMLYESNDLLNWRKVKCILTQSSCGDRWFRDYWWAPEIHKKDNKFYLTVNCRNEDMGIGQTPLIAVSDTIDGEYLILNPNSPLIANGNILSGNDGNLFTDDDGKTYISTCNESGLWAYETDLESCELKGDGILLAAQEKEGWDTKNEGPFVFKRGGKYYCFYSSFTRSYEMGISTADSITGPWVKDERNPVVSPASPIRESGHNCIFEGVDGNLWIAYHITLEGSDRNLLAIDPIEFDENENIIVPPPSIEEKTIEY